MSQTGNYASGWSENEIQKWKEKADKWDKLSKAIEACYVDEEGNELSEEEGGDLCTIGEIAVLHLGFM